MNKQQKEVRMAKTTTELLLELIDDLKPAIIEAEKLDKGNRSAGGRLRKIIAEVPKKIKIIKAVSLGKDVE